MDRWMYGQKEAGVWKHADHCHNQHYPQRTGLMVSVEPAAAFTPGAYGWSGERC